ncbi:Alpha-acetolactate decarboxylase [Aquicella siphonis]|uniref:Alpha-acetolactate decarboxylase n=1 Tax=Aquicella siphonis TaxID=254247 RepID=A0A5E4PEI8_9COXI|nr:acetolactate decarboxylase [Aquicella siphonis]VVC75399.1 Alpha-acetolactate decarboxylase [Aquicella siphonis]
MKEDYDLKNCSSTNAVYSRLGSYISLFVLSCSVYAGPIHEIRLAAPAVSLFQLGNASALFSGAIEGEITYRQLKTKGDFGLGTFNGIRGEMVALDGNFYKIGQKGETIPVNPDWKTPFVELVTFSQNKAVHFDMVRDYVVLKQSISSKLENKNIPYAIKVTGIFKFLKLRSRSPRVALRTQDVIEETYFVENVKGTLVGFWFPEYLLSLTVPEFHFHFIADDRRLSGHVLELKAENVDVTINRINQIELAFPQTHVYKNAKITAATLDRYNRAQMNGAN